MRPWYEPLLNRDLVPEALIRMGVRRLIAQRLREEDAGSLEARQLRLMNFVRELRASPVAIHTADANRQHYELPARFFELVLGPHRKYSCSFWAGGTDTLADAEAQMLRLTAQRARIEDGNTILELGGGWGSLSLYLAEHFPNSIITAVSNSESQREYIEAQARQRGIANLRLVTRDMNDFSTSERFDRVVSVEMFEHMRNYEQLLSRIAGWLRPDGLLFVHIFAHIQFAYSFEIKDATDWMAEHFFTGGIMPSDSLLLYFGEHMHAIDHWRMNGRNYQKTAEAWLKNLQRHRAEVLALFTGVYGAGDALLWFVRWKCFFIACAEVWGHRGGNEWIISHYLLKRTELNF